MVREEMEGAVKLDVPLTVDLKSGDDWESLDAHPGVAETPEQCPSFPRSKRSRASCAR